MRKRTGKLRISTEHGVHKAEGVFAMCMLLLVENVRHPRLAVAALTLLALIFGISPAALSLFSKVF